MKDRIPILLLVDDEPAHVEAIRRAFLASDPETEIWEAGSLREYREALAVSMPDIAILDLNLPDGLAVEVLTAPSACGGSDESGRSGLYREIVRDVRRNAPRGAPLIARMGIAPGTQAGGRGAAEKRG